MTKQTQKQEGIKRSSEQGNVLFLILIAVALFAALSYAVTQSTRSGGGDAGKETSLVNSSTITQYPASVKTAIVRMIVSNGVSVDTLLFDPPSNFTALTTPEQAQAVFHPNGGGASYSLAPSSVMASASPGTWHFNSQNQILNIGTDTADNTANDVIAFLPGVSLSICTRIHTQLGISTAFATANTADETGINDTADMVKATSGIGTYAAGKVIGGATATALTGQPQGCFKNGTAYTYYHALVER